MSWWSLLRLVRVVVKTQSEHSRSHISYAAWLQLRMPQSIASLSMASHSVLHRGAGQIQHEASRKALVWCDMKINKGYALPFGCWVQSVDFSTFGRTAGHHLGLFPAAANIWTSCQTFTAAQLYTEMKVDSYFLASKVFPLSKIGFQIVRSSKKIVSLQKWI